MRRLLFLVAVLCLVPLASANLDFQSSLDLNSVSGSGYSWVQSTGANNYVSVPVGAWVIAGGIPTTYYAFTKYSGGNSVWKADLLDSSKSSICAYQPGVDDYGVTARYEIVSAGGSATVYRNGINQGTLSCTGGVNPTYIKLYSQNNFGNGFDDIVADSTSSRYIFGNPEPNVYELKKDFLTPAASGFAYASNNVVVNSNNFTTTWGRSNITYPGPESIVLRNYNTGVVYATRSTGAATMGTVSWSLPDEIFGSGAPNGLYEVTIVGSNAVSEPIVYKSVGASVSFNSKMYSAGDTATITYSIDGYPYYDTSSYTYRIDLISLTTGATIHTQDITPLAQTSFITYKFTTSDPQGQYYAALIATPRGTTTDYWLGYDYTSLTAYATFTGYVNDASTANPISGAIVNMTQGTVTVTCTTASSGYYSTTGYLALATMFVNATATGYSPYRVNITPLSASGISLNITLNSTSPTDSGRTIWGTARDGSFDGIIIANGYGRPIAGASILVTNISTGETYTKATNNAGGYLCGELESCFLTSGRVYNISGSKAGYNTSPFYQVVMP